VKRTPMPAAPFRMPAAVAEEASRNVVSGRHLISGSQVRALVRPAKPMPQTSPANLATQECCPSFGSIFVAKSPLDSIHTKRVGRTTLNWG